MPVDDGNIEMLTRIIDKTFNIMALFGGLQSKIYFQMQGAIPLQQVLTTIIVFFSAKPTLQNKKKQDW
jgi:hypothetical protein